MPIGPFKKTFKGRVSALVKARFFFNVPEGEGGGARTALAKAKRAIQEANFRARLRRHSEARCPRAQNEKYPLRCRNPPALICGLAG
jgi:hypothetical protein